MIYSGFANREEDLHSICRLAGEKLSDILGKKHELPSEEFARKKKLTRLAAEDLTSAFADDAQDISIRTQAAVVMEGLLSACYVADVEDIMLRVVPKVNPCRIEIMTKRYASPTSPISHTLF
jgi:hypothetical protein